MFGLVSYFLTKHSFAFAAGMPNFSVVYFRKFLIPIKIPVKFIQKFPTLHILYIYVSVAGPQWLTTTVSTRTPWVTAGPRRRSSTSCPSPSSTRPSRPHPRNSQLQYFFYRGFFVMYSCRFSKSFKFGKFENFNFSATSCLSLRKSNNYFNIADI